MEQPSPGPIADFVGTVTVTHAATTALPLMLQGAGRGGRGERLLLAFSRAPAQRVPDRLTDPRVERSAAGGFTLSAAEGRWTIEPSTHFLHRDVGREFYRVLPPFSVPWKKRALWRLILIAARLKL